MILGPNILSLVTLVVDTLKTIYIFGGFSMWQAFTLMLWIGITAWVLSAVSVFQFRGGND